MAGRDTKTRYQGVYGRHAQGCAKSVEKAAACDCKRSYFGVVYDKSAGSTRKTRHFATAGAARNARADLAASLRMGRPVGTSAMRLDATIEKFNAGVSDGIVLNKHGRRYRPDAATDLRLTLGHLPDAFYGRRLEDLGCGDFQGAIEEWLEAGLSGSRIRARINAVRSLYRWAISREFAVDDPTREVRLPALDSEPRDRVATPAEFASLLAVVADEVPLAIAGYSSARAAEVRRLDWTDVDLDKQAMLLAAPGGKSAAARRIVPIVRPLLAILRAAHLKAGRPKAGKVCKPRRGSKSGEMALNRYLDRCRDSWDKANADERKRARKEGGKPKLLTPINLQESRHTCATWLDHAGVSPKVASVWLGHSTPSHQPGAAPLTLNTYTHVLAGELDVARDQLDGFLAERTKLREAK